MEDKKNKASADEVIGSIAVLLGASAEVVDAINNAANGNTSGNNNPSPSSTTEEQSRDKVNPLWVGLGIGGFVLLIIGLLIYSNNGNKNIQPSSAAQA